MSPFLMVSLVCGAAAFGIVVAVRFIHGRAEG
jgi:hypothetical protein